MVKGKIDYSKIKQRFTLRIPTEEYIKWLQKAKEENLSLNIFIFQIIEKYLKSLEKKRMNTK